MNGQSEASEARLKALTDKLETGVSHIFESDQYTEYLTTMSKFHHYSFRNILLIFMQRPDATCVAGYNDWKNKFGRHVKAHEHGIQILAPSTHRRWVQQEKRDPETNQPVYGADGQPVMEWVKAETVTYRIVTVFDVSQTEGKELPTLGVMELSGDVAEYERIVSALVALSPLPVVFEAFPGAAKGYCSYVEQRIVIQPGMRCMRSPTPNYIPRWIYWKKPGRTGAPARWRRRAWPMWSASTSASTRQTTPSPMLRTGAGAKIWRY